MKIPSRIEVKTLKKILDYSNTNGPQRKTNIATHCKMNYTRFIPYLNVMIMLNLLENFDNNVRITEFGKWILNEIEKNTDHNSK